MTHSTLTRSVSERTRYAPRLRFGLVSNRLASSIQGSEDFVPRLPAEKELAAVAEKGKVTSTSGAASSATATANVTAAKAAGETPPALADPNNTGLVLVGWSPYRLNFPYQAHLRRIADQFSSLRRFMGMKFPGIFVWQIPSDAIENLKFRLKWQDRESITDFFCDTLQNLQDLEKFAASNVSLSMPKDSAPTDLLSAQANLLHELANERRTPDPQGTPEDGQESVGHGIGRCLRGALEGDPRSRRAARKDLQDA